MLKKLFDLENPLMKALTTAADLLILNFFTLMLCLPVVTAGAAVTAMNSIIIKMVRGEETYIVKPYFRAFKANFKQGTLLGLIVLAATGFLYLDYLASLAYIPVMRAGIIAIGVIVLAIAFYAFALTARYENKLGTTLKNAAALAVAYFPRTLAMVLFTAVLWVGGVHFYRIGVPLLLLFGFSLPCYMGALLMNAVFKKLDEKNNDERREGTDDK